jgi:penicillin-binding protein 2
MYNTPHNAVFSPGNEHDEFIAPGSKVRLWLLGSVFSLAAMIVIGRVAWVQTQLPDDYLDSLGVTTIEEEAIPARDGRILADSLVLAADVEQYSIQMHYRWLQDEADQNWLKQQVRQVLSREERKNADLVAKAERGIQESRDAMFAAVSEVTAMSQEDLRQRCEKIEQRIRKISDAVNQRASGVDLDAEADEESEEDDSPGLLMRWASSIREALTTPPQREEADRIVVREEETWHVVLENAGAEVAAGINESPEQFPGVRVVAVTQRTYPQNQLAAHVVGARTKVTEKDLASEQSSDDSLSDQGRSDQTRSGRFGVEKSYDHRIAGMSGLRRIVRDRRQRIVSSEIVRRPVSGRDVVLTLNTEVQKVAEQLLAESLGDAERELLKSRPKINCLRQNRNIFRLVVVLS